MSRLHPSDFISMPRYTKYHLGCFSLSPIKKQIFRFGYSAPKRKDENKAREAGSVFRELKMGSLRHDVGTKASLVKYKDSTYYYTVLETKQVFCNELFSNGTSDTVISGELRANIDNWNVNSESANCSERWEDKHMLDILLPNNLVTPFYST